MNGSCLRTGVTRNVSTQAYIRELYIEDLDCFNSGNASHPAIDILSTNTTSGDATNEVTFQDINIFAPYGSGFVLHSNGASTLRLINVNNLRVEGLQTGVEPGNLVQVGDSSLSGLVDTVSFNQLQLISPYLGYAAFDMTADTSADQPYFINANNVETSGGAYGQGLRIEADRNSSFSFQGIGTNDYNVYVGASPLVGSGIVISDNGNESSLYTSIDPTAVADVRLPSGQTLASVTSGTPTNVAFGSFSFAAATSSVNNSAFGYQALWVNSTGYDNTALGFLALTANTTGYRNTAIGRTALSLNTTGFFNTAVGDGALASVIGASNNTAVGQGAFANTSNGSGSNTALGEDAGFWNQTGSGNTAIGFATDGIGNNAFGSHSNNTELGTAAGNRISTGSDNIFLGYGAASTTQTGANNIVMGYNIDLPVVNGSNQLDIGNLVFGTGLSSTYAAAPAGNIGIGTTTPSSRLTVWGADSASSTPAFNVVNSASTTVFSVFDGGNAELSGSLSQSSDQRLKTNIQSLDASSSLSLIDQLNPVTFNWIDPNQTTALQLGFIAQQVQQIFPQPRLHHDRDRAHARRHPLPQLHRPHLADRFGDPSARSGNLNLAREHRRGLRSVLHVTRSATSASSA